MKLQSLLLATLGTLALSACGPTVEPAPSDALASTTAELVTCSNDCAAYGGQAISCQGNTCSAGANHVVCDGQYTYCPGCTSPAVTCSNGTVLQCTGTSSCSAGADYVVCDGQYTYCPTGCTSPKVACPGGALLQCTGTSSCGLGSTGCSVECDGVEYSCPNVRPGQSCPNDA